MGRTLPAALLGLLLAGPAAAAPHLADIEVYDRTAGRFLPVHEHAGRRYVAGEPGHEYRITLRSRDGARLLAVTSVDGVNVISGQTAAPDQSGYVLDPHGTLAIDGWRKSMDDIAAFHFTRHRNSYAARTGRPFDVGVIGVALFREKRRCCDWFGWHEHDGMRDQAGRAPEAAASPDLQSRSRREEKLGTGHGRREHSTARYTAFERTSDTPDEILALYYDTRENLVAQGVIPRHRHYAERDPRPFPGAFVPDP